jgi:hypothetical protein
MCKSFLANPWGGTMMITVWKITGEACTDSSGGIEEYLVLTASDTLIPDVHQALVEYCEQSGCTERSWYMIHRIERVGVLPAVMDAHGDEAKCLDALMDKPHVSSLSHDHDA